MPIGYSIESFLADPSGGVRARYETCCSIPGAPSFALALLAGCGGTSTPVTPGQATPAPLSAANVNLIFVVSEDLNNNASGDIDPYGKPHQCRDCNALS